jgi:hypothetical protein
MELLIDAPHRPASPGPSVGIQLSQECLADPKGLLHSPLSEPLGETAGDTIKHDTLIRYSFDLCNHPSRPVVDPKQLPACICDRRGRYEVFSHSRL